MTSSALMYSIQKLLKSARKKVNSVPIYHYCFRYIKSSDFTCLSFWSLNEKDLKRPKRRTLMIHLQPLQGMQNSKLDVGKEYH